MSKGYLDKKYSVSGRLNSSTSEFAFATKKSRLLPVFIISRPIFWPPWNSNVNRLLVRPLDEPFLAALLGFELLGVKQGPHTAGGHAENIICLGRPLDKLYLNESR